MSYIQDVKGDDVLKKVVAIIVAVIMICTVFSGCSPKTVFAEYGFSFYDEPVADEKNLELTDGANALRITFDVPEAGYIKLLCYDSTEYEEWPDETAEICADFKDESGNSFLQNIAVDEGYYDKYIVDKGLLSVEITLKNKPSDMNMLCVSWAYAPLNKESVHMEAGKKYALAADENGEAEFTLSVDTPSLVKITPAEACVYECDCVFRVENGKEEKITDALSIHGTEWISRKVFLEKGDYTVTVGEISAVACCEFVTEKTYENLSQDGESADGQTVVFGFNGIDNNVKTARFTAEGENYLAVEAQGTDTYYDSMHSVNVVITDSVGNVVLEECVEENSRIDISGYSGEYEAAVSANGSCVVEISKV